MVPRCLAISSRLVITPPATLIKVPISSIFAFVQILTLEIATIDERASPLNPNVEIDLKSSASLILLVACLSVHNKQSSLIMPDPLSVTLINFLPPLWIFILIFVVLASSAFSTSSFTTDAGRSTTSPAAI